LEQTEAPPNNPLPSAAADGTPMVTYSYFVMPNGFGNRQPMLGFQQSRYSPELTQMGTLFRSLRSPSKRQTNSLANPPPSLTSNRRFCQSVTILRKPGFHPFDEARHPYVRAIKFGFLCQADRDFQPVSWGIPLAESVFGQISRKQP
jgi:hypothetical protein